MASWWLNQPIWKILVKVEHFPKFRDEHKKYLKPPPRWPSLNHPRWREATRQQACLIIQKGRCCPQNLGLLNTSMACLGLIDGGGPTGPNATGINLHVTHPPTSWKIPLHCVSAVLTVHSWGESKLVKSTVSMEKNVNQQVSHHVLEVSATTPLKIPYDPWKMLVGRLYISFLWNGWLFRRPVRSVVS